MPSSDFMNILEGTEYSFLRENEHLANKIMLLWEGFIDRKKIIAFCQDRNESEVLQHMNVRDAHIIDIPAEEWEQALEERRKAHEASLERLRMLYKQSN